jgi:hypothetical protein
VPQLNGQPSPHQSWNKENDRLRTFTIRRTA